MMNFYSLIIIQMAAKTEAKETSVQPLTQQLPKRKTPHYFDLVEYPSDGICEQLSFMLIRPPRFTYNPTLIAPNMRNRKRFTMETVDIGFEITIYKQKFNRYIVLYLHGNGSSRVEANLSLHTLPDDVGMACFDFSGCGNRYDSEYITLGQKESKDVDVAARYLKEQGYRVVGWGRSMGGVSLLKSSQIDIMVSDSAYSNLNNLCKESSAKSVPGACCCFFHIFFPCFFSCIKCKIESKSGLEVNEMDVKGHLKKISEKPHNKQICFIHGEEDSLIPVHHAQKLYDSFNGRKLLILFEGTHNSNRNEEVIDRCFKFIEQGIKKSEGNAVQNVMAEKENIKIKEMDELGDIKSIYKKLDQISKRAENAKKAEEKKERKESKNHNEIVPVQNQNKIVPAQNQNKSSQKNKSDDVGLHINPSTVKLRIDSKSSQLQSQRSHKNEKVGSNLHMRTQQCNGVNTHQVLQGEVRDQKYNESGIETKIDVSNNQFQKLGKEEGGELAEGKSPKFINNFTMAARDPSEKPQHKRGISLSSLQERNFKKLFKQ